MDNPEDFVAGEYPEDPAPEYPEDPPIPPFAEIAAVTGSAVKPPPNFGNPSHVNAPTGVKHLSALQRESMALHLRIDERYSLAQIAVIMQLHPGSVWKILKRAMDRLHERNVQNASVMREMQNQILERLLDVNVPKALQMTKTVKDKDGKDVCNAAGEPETIDISERAMKHAELVLRILERQARLYGLDRQDVLGDSLPWDDFNLDELRMIQMGEEVGVVIRHYRKRTLAVLSEG